MLLLIYSQYEERTGFLGEFGAIRLETSWAHSPTMAVGRCLRCDIGIAYVFFEREK